MEIFGKRKYDVYSCLKNYRNVMISAENNENIKDNDWIGKWKVKTFEQGFLRYLLSADLPSCAAGRRWSDVLVLVVQHLRINWQRLKVWKLKSWKVESCRCTEWRALAREFFTLQSTITASSRSWAVRVGQRWVETCQVVFTFKLFNLFCNLDFWLETVHAWLDISWIYQFQSWNIRFFTHHLCWSRLLEAIHTSVPLTGHLQKGWS